MTAGSPQPRPPRSLAHTFVRAATAGAIYPEIIDEGAPRPTLRTAAGMPERPRPRSLVHLTVRAV
jgi:hypothetical protein